MKSTSMSLETPIWDVVATECAGHDVRWFAVQVALELAAGAIGPVRLFTDFAEELRSDSISATKAFTKSPRRTPLIYPHRLLSSVNPAKNLLAVFDSVVPGAYFRKAANGLRLLPLWRSGALTSERTPVFRDRLKPLEQGLLGRGIVKPFSGTHAPSLPGVADAVREVLMDDFRHRTVFLAPSSPTSSARWLDVLSKSSVPTTILLLQSANGIDLDKPRWEGTPVASVKLLTRSSKLVVLPSMSSRELGYCIESSELVLTTSDALALIAANFGKPAAYFPEARGFDEALQASRNYHSIMFGGESPAIREAMAKLSVSWKYGVKADECFEEFIKVWDETIAAAKRGGMRYRAMPSVCDQAQITGALRQEQPSRSEGLIASFAETRPFESIRHAACMGALTQ